MTTAKISDSLHFMAQTTHWHTQPLAIHSVNISSNVLINNPDMLFDSLCVSLHGFLSKLSFWRMSLCFYNFLWIYNMNLTQNEKDCWWGLELEKGKPLDSCIWTDLRELKYLKRESGRFLLMLLSLLFSNKTQDILYPVLWVIYFTQKKKGVNISRKYRKSLGNILVRGAKLNLSI